MLSKHVYLIFFYYNGCVQAIFITLGRESFYNQKLLQLQRKES